MSRQFIQGFSALLMCSMLVLAGCSKNDSGKTQDAQAQLNQANQNLKDAQAQVEKAKEKAAQQASQDNADKQIADAKAEKQAASKQQNSAREKSGQSSQQARSDERAQAKSNNQPVCNDCGTIRSVTPITRQPEHGSGVGAVAGGVAGGVIGSQIGHGAGKTIAEIAGALGGAYAGNVAEKQVRKVTVYQVQVAMDAGGTQTVTVDKPNGISAGTRVRVQGNNIVLMH
ncbi:MAG: glycine zipper 2TM domain-containing protein [Salinisphaera sp.]|jgi:outer membrane lipoprotein SlyB|nr:glycine zipper 2TM domain-containing protein [Salinisphaera sp.]